MNRKEIECLLQKYSVSHKNLARLLGWGSHTIYRYLKGMTTPDIKYSNELKKLFDVTYMDELLEKNKNLVNPTIYLEVKNSINKLKKRQLKDKQNIIDIQELKSLLEKYSMKPPHLAALLNIHSTTIYGYLKGLNPNVEYSDKLKELFNIANMEELLEKNKNLVTSTIYLEIKNSIIKLKDKEHKIANIEKLLEENKNYLPPEAYQKIKNAINML